MRGGEKIFLRALPNAPPQGLIYPSRWPAAWCWLTSRY